MIMPACSNPIISLLNKRVCSCLIVITAQPKSVLPRKNPFRIFNEVSGTPGSGRLDAARNA